MKKILNLVLLSLLLASTAQSQVLVRNRLANRVVTIVMPYSSGTGLWDGGPEDTLAAGVATNTGWVSIGPGARYVEILARDSITTALYTDGVSPTYQDSLGSFFYQLSDNQSNYYPIDASQSTGLGAKDSVKVSYTGKFIDWSLSGRANAPQAFEGYLRGYVFPYATLTPLNTVPYTWFRLGLQPRGRPYCKTCTANAPVLGLRLLVRVYYEAYQPGPLDYWED